MNFTGQHKQEIDGILHGFDRIILRGAVTNFFYPNGMMVYLSRTNTLLKDFTDLAEAQTKALRTHLENQAAQSGVVIEYLNSTNMDKDARAKEALSKNPGKTGLIAAFSVIEVAPSFTVRSNGQSKKLEVRKEMRQHLHYYFYYMDTEFGWMHVRLQSWYPFSMQIYVNGKEWLKRQLDKNGITYQEYRNSITEVSDLVRAQALSDTLVEKNWQRFGDAFARRLNLHLGTIEQAFGQGYKWSVHQCEYASDVLFKRQGYLEELFPQLVQQSILFNGGEDIYTFFGRNLAPQSRAQVTGSAKHFDPGFRVKHFLDKNSIKMYNKSSVLRIETSINNPKAFKIFKETKQKGQATKAWVPMGKGVSNLYRFAQVAQQANMKYLHALAEVKPPSTLPKKVEQISQTAKVKSRNGLERNVPGLNLLAKPTSLLLEAINDARFCLKPFSNATLRQVLIEKGVLQVNEQDPGNLKRLANKVTRLLAKLKAHKLIVKINKTFTYRLSAEGQKIVHNLLKFKKLELAYA
jgi:hypothetical protein